MHPTTFGFLSPSEKQKETMEIGRKAAMQYATVLEQIVPEGPDKTYLMRKLREVAMWVNVSITRAPDGTPRT